MNVTIKAMAVIFMANIKEIMNFRNIPLHAVKCSQQFLIWIYL